MDCTAAEQWEEMGHCSTEDGIVNSIYLKVQGGADTKPLKNSESCLHDNPNTKTVLKYFAQGHVIRNMQGTR